MLSPTITREFEVVAFNPATMSCDVVADLRIDGKDPADCWKQAEQWRDQNAPEASVRGVFKDKSIMPVLTLKQH